MLLERKTVMSTLKAFGISCGFVLGVGIVSAVIAAICTWKPWLGFATLAVLFIAAATLVLRGD